MTNTSQLIILLILIFFHYLLHSEIIFVWIPGHIGIDCNEKAGKMAKEMLGFTSIELDIPWELGEKYQLEEKYILNKWQETRAGKAHPI